MIQMPGPYRTTQSALLAFFVLALLLGGLGMATGNRAAPDATEKRTLAEFPDMPSSLSGLAGFRQGLAAYMADHFGGRRLLIELRNRLLWWSFRAPGTDELVTGRQGWFYYVNNGLIEEYTGKPHYDKARIDSLIDGFVAKKRKLESLGIDYLLALVPNKNTVYPEFNRPEFNQPGLESRLERIRDRVAERGVDLPMAGITDCLRSSKDEGRLYYKTDTHWNELGALFGARCLLSAVRGLGYDVDLPALDDYRVQWRLTHPGDLAKMADLFDVIQERVPVLIPETPPAARLLRTPAYLEVPENPDFEPRVRGAPPRNVSTRHKVYAGPRGRPRLVLVGDSCTIDMVPYLAERFSRSAVVWSWGGMHLENHLDIIKRESPDLVVEEIVERHL